MLGRVLLRCGAPAIARPVTRSIVLPFRSYATPGRPKSVVGEPSRPVKRAVKKAAAKPADGSSPAEKKVAARRTGATKKSKKTAPKKPKLTEEEAAALKERQAKAKARKQVREEKNKLNELKKIALEPPKLINDNPYGLFTSQKNKELGPLGSSTSESTKKRFAERVAAIGAEWKSLAAADREHYNHLSRAAAEASLAEYKRWVESHSADEIRLANNARKQLELKAPSKKSKASKWPLIRDERTVRRAMLPFILFATNRQASGDFRQIPVTERLQLLGQEWKALSESEKQKYQQMHEQDTARYEAEYQDAYGIPSPRSLKSATPPPSTTTSEATA